MRYLIEEYAQVAILLLLGLTLISTAYVFADTVVPTNEVVTRVVVRAGTSSGTADIGSLRPGEQSELLASVPNWYRVRLANGTEGFVAKRWTRVISTTSSTTLYTLDAVDIGTGLGLLVRGPDFTFVYDGGSNDDDARGSDNRMLAYIKAVAPSLTTIDYLILSHPHTDHVVLLADLFDAYQVRKVWDSGRLNDVCGYRAFLTAVANEPGIEYHSATQDFGTQHYSLPKKSCFGQSPAVLVLNVPHASRINNVSVTLGQGAFMTILYADGAQHSSVNANSLVVRLDLGTTQVLLMGDAEAGGRKSPTVPPSASSIEGKLVACCSTDLTANVLVVGHHGSRSSSRKAFLDKVGASVFIVSSGPTKYDTVVLPDQDVITEIASRGQVFRTDLNDQACAQNSAKIGPDADGKAGGCDNVRVEIPASGPPHVDYWRGSE